LGVVPVRLDDDELKRIDLLVQQKHYKSRNEAIRKMLKSKLSEELSEDDDVHDLVGALLRLKKKGKDPLVLKHKKTAVETVAEGRRKMTYVETNAVRGKKPNSMFGSNPKLRSFTAKDE
jgi:metal-responsive CopG/Arc/MetJ family transcriptional regulator